MPRHTRTRRVTSLITTTTMVPVAALAPAVTALTPPLGLVLRTPVRALADAAIDRFPEGPSEEQRRRSRFTVVALALGEGGTTGRGVVRGGDVYSLTATCAVQAASLLADEGYDRTGVLSPASAFDPPAFLDFLRFLCVADGEKARRVMGFVPRHDIRSTIQDFLGVRGDDIERRAGQRQPSVVSGERA